MNKDRRKPLRFLPFATGSTPVAGPWLARTAGPANPANAYVTITPADRLPKAERSRHER